jgi:hypothetical protein
MTSESRTAITPQLFIGIFITLFGVVLTLERLNLIGPGHLKLFWPLALLTLGTSLMMRRQDSKGRFWGIFWAAIGFWLLLNALGLMAVSLGDMVVPLVLILIGATLVSRTLRGSGPQRPPRPQRPGLDTGMRAVPPVPPVPPVVGVPRSDASGRVSLFAMMGEAKRASNDNPFRGGEMTAVMGGCVLDLRQAQMAPGDQAVLNILAVMAGHEIWVPQGWTVASDVVPLLGGTDDKRLPPLAPVPPDAPKLLLKGFVLMGGVVVKN